MTDPADWKSLSPAFKAALRRYDQAARVRVLGAQKRDAVTAPLFHYTDRGGLNGIIASGEFWFTHYQHLNDDKEITFGMEVAKAVLSEFGARFPKAKIFCDVVADLFHPKTLTPLLIFTLVVSAEAGMNSINGRITPRMDKALLSRLRRDCLALRPTGQTESLMKWCSFRLSAMVTQPRAPYIGRRLKTPRGSPQRRPTTRQRRCETSTGECHSSESWQTG